MLRIVTRALLAAALCLPPWGAAHLGAQAPSAGSPTRVRLLYRDALAPLDSDYVWDAPPGAPVLDGLLLSWTDSTVVLRRPANREWKIRMTRVDWVEVAAGRDARMHGALTGAMLGAMAGPTVVLFGYARHYLRNDPVSPHAPIRAYQISAYLGAAAGAVIGAIVPRTRWVRVFTRSTPRTGTPGQSTP